MKLYATILLVIRMAMATDSVILRKVGPDDCGQATIPKQYEADAVKYWGLEEGNCSAAGYTVPAGNKTLNIPFFGEVDISVFKKADPLAFLKKAGKQALGQVVGEALGVPATKKAICCNSCKVGHQKHVRVNDATRRCEESCLAPKLLPVYKYVMPEHFAGEKGIATNGTCASLGYGIYDETIFRGMVMGLDVDLYKLGAVPKLGPEGWITIFRPDGIECVQATVEAKSVGSIASFAGFTAGKCEDQGFTEEQELQVPSMLTGSVELILFKKPGELSILDTLRFARFMTSGEAPKNEPSDLNFLV